MLRLKVENRSEWFDSSRDAPGRRGLSFPRQSVYKANAKLCSLTKIRVPSFVNVSSSMSEFSWKLCVDVVTATFYIIKSQSCQPGCGRILTLAGCCRATDTL